MGDLILFVPVQVRMLSHNVHRQGKASSHLDCSALRASQSQFSTFLPERKKLASRCCFAAGGLSAWAVLLIVAFAATILAAAGFGVYKDRIRSHMQSEILAIMSQYMPLENECAQEDTFKESATSS